MTPLSVRPEDPDRSNIRDQNDFMPSVSPNGKLVLFTSSRSGVERLYVMNRDGSNQHLISTGPGTQMQGSWSPNGKKIVYLQSADGKHTIAVMNADGSDPRDIAKANRKWEIPAWSPDGDSILFHATGEDGSDDIWSINSAGGEAEVLLSSASADWQAAWSPDGNQLVFISRRDGKDFEIYSADPDGGPWSQLTDNQVNDYTPSWSPDGSQIVFQSESAGRWTIVTMNSDGSRQTPVSRYPMQWDPVWSQNGEIFFNSGRDGRRGIYVMNADGTYQRKLTNREPSTLVSIVREAGVDEAARIFYKARTENSQAAYFYEREIQYLGENFLEMGHLRQATLLFEINVAAYPDSKQAHMDLGKSRLAADEIQLATQSYQRAYEIDPEDGQISRLVDQLNRLVK